MSRAGRARPALAPRCAAILVLLAAAKGATGQAGVWTTRGPLGGNVYCLVADPVHPSTFYAGTARGVFKSVDAGATWQAAASGIPPATRVQTIAIDPTAPATLYAGTTTPDGVESIGIFKSTDGAGSWTAINNGLSDPVTGITPLDVEALGIDPRNPGTIYAGSRYSEIFKSTDGGATWQPKTLGGFNIGLQTSAFQFDPTDRLKIYAASTSGLLRSTDGGESWSVYGNTVSMFALVIDPTSPATLYAGNLTGYGVLKSTDGGAHFTSLNKGLPASGSNSPFVTALALDPAHTSTIYAGTYGNGLFVSTDGAVNWARADTGIRSAYVVAFAFAPGQSTTIYSGTLGGGVYQSLDSGRTWSLASNGLDLSLVYALTIDPAAPDTLYAATFDGVEKSNDGGGSWLPANSGLPVNPVAALVLSPANPKTAYAGTLGGGLYKTTDGGSSWSASNQGLTDSHIASIAIDPSSPSTLYAGTAHPDTSQSERVFKSTDAGASWTQTTLDAKSFPIDFIAVNPARTSQVLAGSQGVIGYFQSLDAGKTWSTVSASTACGGTNSLLFEPSGSTLYLAGTGGVCRTSDGGATWTLASARGYSVASILLDPSSPSTVYAGASLDPFTATSGIFRSADRGQTWQPLGNGFPAATVTALATDSLGKTLHAGTIHGGVVELAFPKDRQPVGPPPVRAHGSRVVTPH